MSAQTHTTNYLNTFIQVAEDCPVIAGEIPPLRGTHRSMANLQFDMIHENPYVFSSDEVLFLCHVQKSGITDAELEAAKEAFFAKGQPCFRASPLTKRYGWGIHSNDECKIALCGVETDAYQAHSMNPNLKILKAMRSQKR